MDIFSVISIIGFAAVVAGCVSHFVFRGPCLDDLFGEERGRKYLDGVRFLVLGITLLLPVQGRAFLVKVRRLLLCLGVVCFLVLAVTGFYPNWVLGESIFGYWTMIHITFGGIFAFCLALLAVLWAEDNRLNAEWCPLLRKVLSLGGGKIKSGESGEFLQRVFFWLIMILAVPLVLSVLLSMFELFGTEVQEFLLAFHKYTGLAFALSAILFAYLAVINNAKKIQS